MITSNVPPVYRHPNSLILLVVVGLAAMTATPASATIRAKHTDEVSFGRFVSDCGGRDRAVSDRPSPSLLVSHTPESAVRRIGSHPRASTPHYVTQQPPPIMVCWVRCRRQTDQWLEKRVSHGVVPTTDELIAYFEGCMDACFAIMSE